MLQADPVDQPIPLTSVFNNKCKCHILLTDGKAFDKENVYN